MRRVPTTALLVALALFVVGCGGSSNSAQPAAPETGVGSTEAATTASTIGDGTYLVGTDIPAGRYKGTTTSDNGYWQISSDPNGSDIISNNNTTGPFYVEVKKGQYLQLSGVDVRRVK